MSHQKSSNALIDRMFAGKVATLDEALSAAKKGGNDDAHKWRTPASRSAMVWWFRSSDWDVAALDALPKFDREKLYNAAYAAYLAEFERHRGGQTHGR